MATRKTEDRTVGDVVFILTGLTIQVLSSSNGMVASLILILICTCNIRVLVTVRIRMGSGRVGSRMGECKTERQRGRAMTAAREKTGRLCVERSSVRGYQCYGSAAGLSCELLIYRAWRTATAFHPLCRHGRRRRGGLVSFFFLTFILSRLQYLNLYLSLPASVPLFFFFLSTLPFWVTHWASIIILNQPTK